MYIAHLMRSDYFVFNVIILFKQKKNKWASNLAILKQHSVECTYLHKSISLNKYYRTLAVCPKIAINFIIFFILTTAVAFTVFHTIMYAHNQLKWLNLYSKRVKWSITFICKSFTLTFNYSFSNNLFHSGLQRISKLGGTLLSCKFKYYYTFIWLIGFVLLVHSCLSLWLVLLASWKSDHFLNSFGQYNALRRNISIFQIDFMINNFAVY